MSAESLLEKAYNAYGEYLHWQSGNGRPLVHWEDLHVRQRGAWAAFAREVVAEVQK